MKRRDAGATQEISFEDILEEIPILTARRPAPSPDATQEIQAGDILETVPATAPSSSRDAERAAPSIAPFAVDVAPSGRRADSTFVIEPVDSLTPRRHLGWLVASVLSLAVGILVVAIVRKGANQEVATATAMAPVRTAPLVRVPVPPASVAPEPLGASPPAPIEAAGAQPTVPVDAVPVVQLDSLPRVGTVVGPRNVRLWVDGVPVRGSSSTVRCGVHRVMVGRRVRAVDIPCGGEVVVH